LLRWVGRGLLEQAKKRGDEQQKCKTLFFHDFNSLLVFSMDVSSGRNGAPARASRSPWVKMALMGL
jgi:hypothetical protein